MTLVVRQCLFFATQNTVIVFDATILTYMYCGFRLICNDSRGITIIAVIQFITIVHYNINVSHHAAAALHPVFHSKYLHTMQQILPQKQNGIFQQKTTSS